MSDWVISIPVVDDDLFDDVNPRPGPSVLMKEYNDGADKRAYLYTAADVSAWPVAATSLGEWATATGAPNGLPDADYATYIGLFGNDAGMASAEKDTLRWQGHPEEKFYLYDDTDPQNIITNRYPATDTPFRLMITRQDYGSTAQPWDNGTTYNTGDFATSGGMWQSLQDGNVGNTPFGGSPFWEFINQSGPWGWRVDMLSDDPLRDITARAIGVYSDPAATSFLFTTGAFVDDGGGNFFTECPPGNRAATADPVYFALLLGAAQEGIFHLMNETDGAQDGALFWQGNA